MKNLKLRNHKLLESLNHSIDGLGYAIRSEKNMRRILFIGLFVLILGFLVELTITEIMILSLTVVLVIFAELVNTAVEFSLDLVTKKQYSIIVKIIKDITAGAVLITSINAVIVGTAIFSRYLPAEISKMLSPLQIVCKYIAVIGFISSFLLFFFAQRKRFKNISDTLYKMIAALLGITVIAIIILLFI